MQSLRVRPADAIEPAEDRILDPTFAPCQVEELFVGGQHELADPQGGPGGVTPFAETSCIR